MFTPEEVTAWLEEDCDSGDVLRAFDLVTAAVEHGTASHEFNAQLRLAVSEYEMPKMLLAVINVLLPLSSTLTHDQQTLMAQLTKAAAKTRATWPSPSKYAPAILASINETEI